MSEELEHTPVAPLPNPGEGGPVDDGAQTPAVPLPAPGAGGPSYDPANIPVAPLPNPGEGGPVHSGSTLGGILGGAVLHPTRLWYAQVRFLNAARGYQPFRVRINAVSAFRWLGFAGLTAYTGPSPARTAISTCKNLSPSSLAPGARWPSSTRPPAWTCSRSPTAAARPPGATPPFG